MTQKLKQSDIDKINSLRDKFQQLYHEVGTLTIDQLLLKEQLVTVESKIQSSTDSFKRLQQEEDELFSVLKLHYGKGQINLADGTFTPDNEMV